MQSTKSSQLEKKVEGFCLIIALIISHFYFLLAKRGIRSKSRYPDNILYVPWIPAFKGLFSL